ncbi:MAG: response regulator [Pseudonocardiaceae bacterium]
MTKRRTAKVLIVDDRQENLLALTAILQGLPVDTVSVTSGEQALKRLLADEYAAILLDAHMPGMDGFETAGHIKQRERTRHIPIIFLTAVAYDAHLAFRSYEAGAVDYITRPFDPWVLRAKVTVFIDLWTINAQLADQAEAARVLQAECTSLRAAVEESLAVLETVSPNQGEAEVAIHKVRTRLAQVRPNQRTKMS